MGGGGAAESNPKTWSSRRCIIVGRYLKKSVQHRSLLFSSLCLPLIFFVPFCLFLGYNIYTILTDASSALQGLGSGGGGRGHETSTDWRGGGACCVSGDRPCNDSTTRTENTALLRGKTEGAGPRMGAGGWIGGLASFPIGRHRQTSGRVRVSPRDGTMKGRGGGAGQGEGPMRPGPSAAP